MAKGRSKKPKYQSEENIPRTRKKLKIQARNPKQREYIRAIREHDITFGMGSAGNILLFL